MPTSSLPMASPLTSREWPFLCGASTIFVGVSGGPNPGRSKGWGLGILSFNSVAAAGILTSASARALLILPSSSGVAPNLSCSQTANLPMPRLKISSCSFCVIYASASAALILSTSPSLVSSKPPSSGLAESLASTNAFVSSSCIRIRNCMPVSVRSNINSGIYLPCMALLAIMATVSALNSPMLSATCGCVCPLTRITSPSLSISSDFM